MLRLKPGYSGEIKSHGSSFRSVVISGGIDYRMAGKEIQSLLPGSYFGSTGEFNHAVFCTGGAEYVIYVRAEGGYRVH